MRERRFTFVVCRRPMSLVKTVIVTASDEIQVFLNLKLFIIIHDHYRTNDIMKIPALLFYTSVRYRNRFWNKAIKKKLKINIQIAKSLSRNHDIYFFIFKLVILREYFISYLYYISYISLARLAQKSNII